MQDREINAYNDDRHIAQHRQVDRSVDSHFTGRSINGSILGKEGID